MGLQVGLAQIASQLIPASNVSSSGRSVSSLQKFFKSIVVISMMICIVVIVLQLTRQRPNGWLKLVEQIVLGIIVLAIAIGAIVSVVV